MSSDPRSVFITGATGCIGSVLAKKLSEEGRPVRAVVRNPSRAAVLRRMANVEIIPGDLSQPESLRGCLEGCSLVYHCAAKLFGLNWAESQAINVDGTQALLDEASRSGVERFIHLSTIGVYGLYNGEVITEDSPWLPLNSPYFKTKQAAERLAQSAAQRMPVSIARLGDVVGPGQYTWTVKIIQNINAGTMPPPIESASGFLNPVYIDNLIDALLLLGAHPAAAGQIFNLVDDTPIRVSEYIRRLARMAGKRVIPLPAWMMRVGAFVLMESDLLRGREVSTNPVDIGYLYRKGKVSGEKIRAVLGWKPPVDQEEAFRRTEVWLRREGYLR